MKIVTFLTGIIVLCSGCSVPQINNPVHIPANVNLNNSAKEIKLSFKLKDAQSISRIKSVDAYLCSNYNNPLSSNVYSSNYKFQADVVNGVINISFMNYPAGGPYYVAIQAFDDIVASAPRKNITAYDSTVSATDQQLSRSVNSVTYQNGQLFYSDNSNYFSILINLIPYNNPPVNLTPQNGSNTPTNDISLG